MKGIRGDIEKVLVKASDRYLEYSWNGCLFYLYQPPIPDKVKERFAKKKL